MSRNIWTQMMWLLLLCILLPDFCTAAGSCTDTSCWPFCVVAGLITGLVCVLLSFIVFGVWLRWRRSPLTSRIFQTKKMEKKAELQKQLQKTREEADAWSAVLTPSEEVMKGLRSQRDELSLQLEEMEREREENKKKVQSVEKEIDEREREKATDKTEGYLREKQNLFSAQWKLEKRKEELEKQQLNTEKLLQKTESLTATIKERKRGVENHMELIHLHLEELENQHDLLNSP